MQNAIPRKQNALLALILECHKGALQHGVTINLQHLTAAVLLAARNDALAARKNYKDGRKLLRDKRAILASIMQSSRDFATIARDVLKPRLGKKYSQTWDTAGFVGSLEVSNDPETLLAVLQGLADYLTAHPEHEAESVDATAARAESLATALGDAIGNLNDQAQVVDGLLATQEAKFAALIKCIRDLIGELEMMITPLDARWLAFGLNKPGAAETPDAPVNLHAVLNGASVTLTWDASARTEHYRVWKKVVGIDAEPVAVEHRTDLAAILNELPSGATVEFAISAVNSGGESPLSEPVIVTIP
jgi:hypothetical protein